MMSALYNLANPAPIPADYIAQLEAIAPSITEKVEEVRTPGEAWADALARIIPAILTTVQQKELLDVQVERARKGLPALDVSSYTSGVNVGLSADTKQLLMYGGIAALAVWAFGSYRATRR